jgi:hypothetical protein
MCIFKENLEGRSNLGYLSAGWGKNLTICLKIFGFVRYMFSQLVIQLFSQIVIQANSHSDG